MSKLIEDVPGLRPYPQGVGIEIEVEGERLPRPEKSPYWSSVADGSLRGGMEYITNGPLPVDATKTKALKSLFSALKERAHVNEDQSRCGVHVHVGVQDLTTVQIYTAIVASILMDNVLLRYSQRENNLFCKPVLGSKGVVHALKKDAKSYLCGELRMPFQSMNNDLVKYSSLNFATLLKFGTLEYRGMRYLGEAEEVDEWSTELYNMVHNAANTWDSPKSMMDWFLNHTKRELMRKLFSPEFGDKLMRDIPNWETLISKNVKSCVELSYNVKWGTKRPASKLKKKSKDMAYYRAEAAARYVPNIVMEDFE